MRLRTVQQRRLASLKLFSGCTTEQIELVDRLGTEVAVAADASVCREDATSPQFVVVLEGRVQLSRAGKDIASLGPGGCFGHAALLANLPAESISCVALTPTRLLAFSRREFVSPLRAAPSFAATLTRPLWVRDRELAPAPIAPGRQGAIA